jgi:hypothetical protein
VYYKDNEISTTLDLQNTDKFVEIMKHKPAERQEHLNKFNIADFMPKPPQEETKGRRRKRSNFADREFMETHDFGDDFDSQVHDTLNSDRKANE